MKLYEDEIELLANMYDLYTDFKNFWYEYYTNYPWLISLTMLLIIYIIK